MSLSFLSQVYKLDEDSDTDDEIEVSGNGHGCKSEGDPHQISICELSTLYENEVDIANTEIPIGDHQSGENGVGGEVEMKPLMDMGFTEELMKTPTFPLSEEMIEDPMTLVMGGGFHHLANRGSDIPSSVKGDKDNAAYWARQRKSAKRKRNQNWKWSWDQAKVKQSTSLIKDRGALDEDKEISTAKTEDKVTPLAPKTNFICKTEPTDPVPKVQAFKCPFCYGVFLEGAEFIKHLSIHVTGNPNKKTVDVKEIHAEPIKTENKQQRPKRKIRRRKKFSNRKISAKCLECKATFCSRWKLKQHMRIHEESDRPWKCAQCKSFFLSLSSLRFHENQAHNRVLSSMQCNFCEKVYNCRRRLTEHIRTHTGERPFMCLICKRSYCRKEHLNRHMKSTHGEDAPTFETDLKPSKQLMFQSHGNPVREKNTIAGNTSRSCKFCGKLCCSRWKLAEHVRIHTGERPFQCLFCRKRFIRNDHLKGHMKSTHGEDAPTFETDLKPNKQLMFQSHGNPAREKDTIAGHTSRSCKFCGKLCGSRWKLTEHVRTHTGERPFQCLFCRKRFIRNDHLKGHVRSLHTNSRPFKCPSCKKRFARKDNVKKHLMVIHGLDASSFSIDLKPSQPLSLQPLSRTSHKHTLDEVRKQVEIHPCKVIVSRCDHLIPFYMKKADSKAAAVKSVDGQRNKKTIQKNSSLQPIIKLEAGIDRQSLIRIRKTSGKNKLECTVCGKGFQKMYKAMDHVLIHTQEKIYECPECSKKFRWRTNLFVHRRIHTNTKPHICNICSKAFRSRSNLTAHTRIHNGQKPFKCRYCSQRFRFSQNLSVHTKSIHGG